MFYSSSQIVDFFFQGVDEVIINHYSVYLIQIFFHLYKLLDSLKHYLYGFHQKSLNYSDLVSIIF